MLGESRPEILEIGEEVSDALCVLLGKNVVGMIVQWQRERHREVVQHFVVAGGVQRGAESRVSLGRRVGVSELLLEGVLVVLGARLVEAGRLLEVLLLL